MKTIMTILGACPQFIKASIVSRITKDNEDFLKIPGFADILSVAHSFSFFYQKDRLWEAQTCQVVSGSKFWLSLKRKVVFTSGWKRPAENLWKPFCGCFAAASVEIVAAR